MNTLVLLDTNAYLRLAKRIQPLLGVAFGQKNYELTILREVEDEVSRQPRLQLQFPWFETEPYSTERLAKRTRLSKVEKNQITAVKSILLDYVGKLLDQNFGLMRRGNLETPPDGENEKS